MKKHATLTLKNVKNGTRIEFRRDINSLLADTTSSSNLFRSWTTRYSLGGGANSAYSLHGSRDPLLKFWKPLFGTTEHD